MCGLLSFCHKRKNTLTKLLSSPSFLLPWFPSTWTPETLPFLQTKYLCCSYSNGYWNFLQAFFFFFFSVVQSAKSNCGQNQNFSLRRKMIVQSKILITSGEKSHCNHLSHHNVLSYFILFSHCKIPNLMQNSVFYHSKSPQHGEL